ncbi:MAG: NfeD family protein [Oscillospiraceae bacterium]|nr:NfeD family protein [Oscillospiraceae bacterium]
MNLPEVIIWAVLLAAFIIIEAVTMQLTSIWFAAGALASLAAAFFGGEVWLQLVCFIAVTAATLLITRPIIVKKLKPTTVATNADRNIGAVCIVNERIDNLKNEGSVRLHGIEWSARSSTGDCIEPGTKVKVLRIEGVKLIVEVAQDNE